ncbi:MAG: S-methyl-5-thioribose-1-phosphate isomerase, partial [Clostridia bacterium]|nr:S-methyl-5-thioribose-1-phosphate isomerase [Clostridia bacterium]
GAPAIGIAAAYGMVLSAMECTSGDCSDILEKMKTDGELLKNARPTAANLEWAVSLMIERASLIKKRDPILFKWDLLNEAVKIHKDDMEKNRRIGINALGLMRSKRNILTHCNAGILATSAYGTATSVFYVGKEKGIDFHVFADETRPWLQGSRLTAYELMENDIEVTIISDGAAAHMMARGEIDAVITGCDRVASNGDTANKIGTLGLSICAKYYDIPFYIAGPLSTIDMKIDSGKDICIEERCGDEVLECKGVRIAPEGARARNPVFDVTPACNITAIITDEGIALPPYSDSLKKLFGF